MPNTLIFNSIKDRKKLENWIGKNRNEEIDFNWSVDGNQLTIEQISPYSIPNTVEGIIKFSRKSKINFNLKGETNE